MRRVPWIPVLVVGLLTGPARADETYTIKIKKAEQGDRSKVEKTDRDDTQTRVLDPDGKALREEGKKKTTYLVYEETVLEKEKGKKKASRLRRKYEKAEVTRDGSTEALPYQGKTVLIEKKAGEYHFRIEGGEDLAGPGAEALNQEFNKNKDEGPDMDELLMPKKPVKVNESWKIDPDAIAKAFEKGAENNITVDRARSAATGKLLRAYQKDGHQFGVIEFAIDLPISGSMKLGDNLKAAVGPGAKFSAKGTVDACIDGTRDTGKSDMQMTADLTATFTGPDGKDYKIVIVSKQTGKSTSKDLGRE